MQKKKHIPIQKFADEIDLTVRHHLNGVDDRGLESRHYLDGNGEGESENFYAHRNESFFFTLTERGHGSMVIDFDLMKFTARDVCFVAPGQVQDDVRASECDYWYVEVATPSIPAEYLDVFENAAPFQKPQNMEQHEFEQCRAVLRLLAEQLAGDPAAVYHRQMIQELLSVFLCIVARRYAQNDAPDGTSRPRQITRDFVKLLKENVRAEKSPSRYAAMLNISEAHLNETVKKTTGFTAGYWIRTNVVLEAKRLLFYTDMTAKEIAHALGYEDHAYFSRLFRQVAGATPLAFRAGCRK